MSLLDPSWKYIPANRTNLKATFARVKKRLAEEATKKKNVTPIKRSVARAGEKA